jgi:hypothetical protein
MANIGRNEPCPCGSGKKYKICCLLKDAGTKNLPPQDVDSFFKLLHPLHYFANQELEVVKGIASFEQFENLSQNYRLIVREALWNHLDLIPAFVRKNPQEFTPDELGIVQRWIHCIHDNFMVMEYTPEYSAFIPNSDATKAYGVLGSHSHFNIMFGSRLPVMVSTVLLPFKNHIIYDGIVKFGDFEHSPRGELYRQLMVATYAQLRKSQKVITSF